MCGKQSLAFQSLQLILSNKNRNRNKKFGVKRVSIRYENHIFSCNFFVQKNQQENVTRLFVVEVKKKIQLHQRINERTLQSKPKVNADALELRDKLEHCNSSVKYIIVHRWQAAT